MHNLHAAAWGQHSPRPFDWAVSFETKARDYMLGGKILPLIHYEKLGPDALLSIPTLPDHYLPLLYMSSATQTKADHVPVPPWKSVDLGSISMLTVEIGSAVACIA